MRSLIRGFNFISCEGSKLSCCLCKARVTKARCFWDEVKGESARSDEKSNVNSLVLSEDLKTIKLNLDIRLLFEENKTFKSNEDCKTIFKLKEMPSRDKEGLLISSESERINLGSIKTLPSVSRHKFSKLTHEIIRKVASRWDNQKKKFVHVAKVLFDKDILLLACVELFNVKVNSVSRDYKSQWSNISISQVEEFSDTLLKETWKPSVIRGVMLLNNKTKICSPFIFMSVLDKIIVQVIKIALKSIYGRSQGLDTLLKDSQYFHSCIFGFKSSKGCHAALQMITTWGYIPWVIPVDLVKCYDVVNLKRLFNILREVFDDKLLINTLSKMFTVKNIKLKKSELFQNNPLSSLLLMIYLNKFDSFFINMQRQVDRGSVNFGKQSLKWLKTTWVKASELKVAKTYKAKYNLRRELYRKKVNTAKNNLIWRHFFKGASPKNTFIQLYYVRYANEYLIGIKGPKSLAVEVQCKTFKFLKSDLGFNMISFSLAHICSNVASFLGFDLKVLSIKKRVDPQPIQNFMNLRNKMVNRKHSMVTRKDRMFKNQFQRIVLKRFKAFLKDKDEESCVRKFGNSLVNEGLQILKKKIYINNDKNSFYAWVDHEFSLLKESWIQNSYLKKHGKESVLEAYNDLICRMEKVISKSLIIEFKLQKSEKVRVNNSLAQWLTDKFLYKQGCYLSLSIYVPIYTLKNKWRCEGILSKSGFPKACGFAFKYHDISIIKFFKLKGYGLLNYYKPATNFYMVKKLINYHLRWSLIYTLAGKHKKKIHEIIAIYSYTPRIVFVGKCKTKLQVKFLSPNEISHTTTSFVVNDDLIQYRSYVNLSMAELCNSKKFIYQ
jgi:hypothetical protein